MNDRIAKAALLRVPWIRSVSILHLDDLQAPEAIGDRQSVHLHRSEVPNTCCEPLRGCAAQRDIYRETAALQLNGSGNDTSEQSIYLPRLRCPRAARFECRLPPLEKRTPARSRKRHHLNPGSVMLRRSPSLTLPSVSMALLTIRM